MSREVDGEGSGLKWNGQGGRDWEKRSWFWVARGRVERDDRR